MRSEPPHPGYLRFSKFYKITITILTIVANRIGFGVIKDYRGTISLDM